MKFNELLNMVNLCETREQIKRAEAEVKSSDVSNDEFDELMMTLSWISRDLCARERRADYR